MTDKQKLLEELEGLAGHAGGVQDLIKKAKDKLLSGRTLGEDELDLVVKKIEMLDQVMRERRDVGH